MKWSELQTFADELVTISLDEHSLLSGERVSAAISSFKDLWDGVRLKYVLKAYLTALEKFVARTTLKIEHCGSISPNGVALVKAHFEKLFGRTLSLRTEVCPQLIAGIRISIGDLVIENSIAAVLDGYKMKTGSGTDDYSHLPRKKHTLCSKK
ncbi:MAG: F0F1 ATP synthase subunit delta [Puniceicoccales bacterium]|jgi:hypothetical protein|nr:F0F1 ATP synthase subunit delta [Puniceicoccales bacterium]